MQYVFLALSSARAAIKAVDMTQISSAVIILGRVFTIASVMPT
jgi:hypothetical protein